MTDDLHAATAAYADTLDRFVAVVDGLADPEYALTTDCPGWTVADQVSHVIAIERDLLGEPDPAHEPDWAALPHVSGSFARYTEIGVDLRRGRPPTALRDELHEVAAGRRPMLAEPPAGEVMSRPAGLQLPSGRVLGMRIFDVWGHLQDVRRAVGRPGDLGGPGAEVARDRLLRGLAIVLSTQLELPAGTGVRFTIRGAVAFDAALVVDEGGRGRVVAGGNAGEQAAILTDWESFVRLGYGRAPATALPIETAGDQSLADRVLAAAAIAP